MEEYKVLIVEDSPTMRQLIAFALKRLKNIKVVEANDGVDGLKKLSQDSFNLIITDINMPVMDGLKLVSLIRKDAVYKTVPIFIITTEGGQEDRERAMALGANAYITKPISAPQVLEMVKNYLKIK
jgi:two-component system, chemotaxis family, chemotaxis protein CheY